MTNDREGPTRKTVYLCEGCISFHRAQGIRDGDYCRRLSIPIQDGQAASSCPFLSKTRDTVSEENLNLNKKEKG